MTRTMLCQDTLAAVSRSLPTPAYDRSSLRAGIVHIGVGAFHRSHQAVVVDELLAQGKARDWAICGVGLLDSDRGMRDVMRIQDCLYTTVVKHPDGRKDARVIGSIVDYLFAPDDPKAVLERMAHPDVRIVSLTITEGGYNFDRVTGDFVIGTPAVARDIEAGATPSTVFAYVVEALRRRRDRDIPPFTVMSCDNIQGNGDIARRMFLSFAEYKDPGLAGWIRDNVAFPNSMVDRITPVTSLADVTDVESLLGVRDAGPVVCEPFFQWVLEDSFTLGRPPLEDAGVQMVDDVTPYELMKLRLLNVSHQGLCYFGYLSGYRSAHEASSDPAIAEFLLSYMRNEAIPTLLPVPGIDLDRYCRQLIDRFQNPEVKDTLARLCAESSDRIPTWLLPVVREQLAGAGAVTLSAAIVASWARYAEATDERGDPIDVVDPLKDQLVAIAQTQRSNPLAFIENRALFGDLADDPRFTGPYLAALIALFTVGAHGTVRSLTSPRSAP